MDREIVIRAALGALCIGLGLTLMLSASRRLGPCTDCEESPEKTAADVAQASAEMSTDD